MSEDLDRRIDRLVMALARADGSFEPGNAEVFRCDDGTALRRLRLLPDVRDNLLARELVEVDSAGMRLTASGRAAAARLSGQPQAYRLQHGAVSSARATIAEAGVGALIDDAESPLGWLHRRKGPDGVSLIDDTEFSAGERLRLDFTKAGMMPSMTSNWREMASSGNGGRGGRADMADAALAARDRVNAALSALDPELAGVAIDVCCFLKGLEIVESDRRWPPRSAKVVLKMALRALARHYGIAVEMRAGEGRGHLQHWGSGDYRPEIGGRP